MSRVELAATASQDADWASSLRWLYAEATVFLACGCHIESNGTGGTTSPSARRPPRPQYLRPAAVVPPVAGAPNYPHDEGPPCRGCAGNHSLYARAPPPPPPF